MNCPECDIVAGKRHPRGISPIRRGAFVVHPRSEEGAVPGWWLIAPARHVEQYDGLAPDEQASLGVIIGELVAAMRASTPAERIYVNVFAEVLHHLHVHVIARPPDLAPEDQGPYLFVSKHVADPREIDDVSARIAARLSGNARNPGAPNARD